MSEVDLVGEARDGRRQALLEAEYGNMLACIRCGLCLTSCPTYVLSLSEAEGPRGRVAMARALTEGTLALTPDLVEHEQNCLVCDACTAVCPAGVHMDPLQVALRSAIAPEVHRPPWQRALRHAVFRWLFSNMAAFRLVARLLWLYQRLGIQRLVRALGVLKLLRLKQMEAYLPSIPRRFVVPRGEVYPAEPRVHGQGQVTETGAASVASVQGGARRTPSAPPDTDRSPQSPVPGSPAIPVSFFAGCVMSTALAEIDQATIRVLQRAGCEVVNTAGQGCCGALNAHGGDLDGAKEMARRNIAAFEGDGEAPVVVNSAGCGAMLKDYAHHFRDDPAWGGRAQAFSHRVQDVTEFLSGRELPMRRPLQARVTYQEPCHLAHAQRIRQQPRRLLQAIPGLDLAEMAESTLCCGSAGVYNVTNPRESRQLQQRKLDHALDTGASVIATANPGCLLQLRSGLAERGSDVQVKHVVELLDEATKP
ncbi:MAG: (Fe-S)-binding protein [Chloroflexota bacterium]